MSVSVRIGFDGTSFAFGKGVLSSDELTSNSYCTVFDEEAALECSGESIS